MKAETVHGFVWDHCAPQYRRFLLMCAGQHEGLQGRAWHELPLAARAAVVEELHGALVARADADWNRDFFAGNEPQGMRPQDLPGMPRDLSS